MPRSTRLPEGRALLLTLVGGVVLACLGMLVSLDVTDAAAGADREALIRRAALTGPVSLYPGPRGRFGFTAARDTTDSLAVDSLAADSLGFDPFGLDSLWFTADADTLDADSLDADSLDGDRLGPDPLGFEADSLDADPLGFAADTLDADSLAALTDTTEVLPDTGRAARLLPPFRRDRYNAALAPRRRAPLGLPLGTYWQRRVELDSTEAAYTITERVGEGDVRVPVQLGLGAYREQRLRAGLETNYRELVATRSRQQQRGGAGLGLLNIEVPGGRNSAFAGIFGSNEVDLRVNGQANVDVGFAYRQNEQQEAATGQGGRVDPDFGQELGLGITGTIGDKLQINVNYDTQNDFDFQNQVKLTYTGYEDEILQSVEAGNVFLQTPSELVRGGQRLFGIKSRLQVGGLGVTVVASQQDAESDELVIEGGSQTTTFSKRPTEYEANANFYLGYYFHNRWDAAHAAPPNIVLGPDFSEILEGQLEVYLFEQSNINNTGSDDATIRALALADLGEPPAVLEGGEAYLAAVGDDPELPDPAFDQYQESDLALLRLPPEERGIDVADRFGLDNDDFFESAYRLLRNGQDYTWDPRLGSLSLKRSLNNNEAIAVAYRYKRADGTIVEIGDFGQGSGSGSDAPPIILKLLRGPNPLPDNATWDLTMRNVYRVGGSSFNATDFDLQVLYAAGGQTAQRTLPGVDVGQQQTLLRTLGLDRVDQDNNRTPDDLFDFLINYTVDPGNGRVIFPYRQPFGEHLRRVLERSFDEDRDGQPTSVSFQSLTQEEAIDRYVFTTLYNAKPEVAARETDKNVYNITGEFRGSVQEFYELGFAVVENSVQVRSGNIELTEGADYAVDYATGTVTITNPAYLVPGRDVRISFERNQFVAIQKKTLLGIRADYEFNDRFAIGATWMQLSEKPLIDKYRLGEEPIANSIWGVDVRYAAEPRWMTRLVDALPLVQTRAPSAFEFKGEFAQLNPGHPETFAFEQSQDDLRELGRDFKDDELDGISYIDDFEGTENSFSLLQPGAWLTASAPEGTLTSPGAGPDDARTYLSELPGEDAITSRLLRTNWRGLFSWYSVLTATYESDAIRPLAGNPATSRVLINEVFPERELEPGTPPTLTTFDVYFDPTRRGPYNFNAALGSAFAERPEEVWGGMAQRLPEGYTDFDARNNIEFVEFIFSPFGGRDGSQRIDPNARLYVELGQTSEDIIPNQNSNGEDGLLGSRNADAYGRYAGGTPDGIVNINDETQRTEDLGLDGLPGQVAAAAAAANGTPYSDQGVPTEAEQFAPFLDSLRASPAAGSPVLALAELDPSGDDFRSFQDDVYFNNGTLWPGGATLQERFSQFFTGTELNSLEAQRQIAQSGVPGNSRFPDSEDINLNLSPDRAERFFRYEIPLDTALLARPCPEGQTVGCNPFYVTTIDNPNIQGARDWYLIRIPVRTDQKEAVGGIEDFSLIETIRVWTDGHSGPATLRFATLDLVGSQWLKSEEVRGEDEPVIGPAPEEGIGRPQSFVATINNEENPNQYEIPNGTVRSFTRDPASSQPIQSREQALVFRVEGLGEGQERAIYKPYTRQLDLTKYSNLRMFVHGEGFEREDSMRVFVRLGSNEDSDYYEIEQPVYPYELPPGTSIRDVPSGSDSLWQTNVPVATPEGTRFLDLNSINIEFDALNKLKLERDLATDGVGAPISRDSVYVAQSIPLDFAPPGARLRIKGNPSIKDVSNIVLGVRNGDDAVGQPRDVEVWYNELRVSGFDEEKGWSGYARTTIRLADFLDINARYNQQTDGFGDLASGLGNRTFDDSWGYSVTTNVNAHKLLPERYGWRIPVNLAVQRDVSTPRFSPSRGDITVAQEIAQIEENDRLSPEEKAIEIDEVKAAAETASFSRVIRVPISKTGSRSPWLKYTLDGVALTYTNSLRQQRSPSRQFNDTDQWSGAFSYRLAVPRPKTVRPFWFLGDAPVVGLLGGLRLNVLPQSFRFSADASRSVNENQDRARRGLTVDSVRAAVEAARPDFVYPIRQQHAFSHRRNVEVQYNPFQFLALGYRSDVSQSLNSAGADEFVSTLVQSRSDVDLFVEYPGLTFEQVFAIDADSNLVGPGFTRFGITDPDSVNALVANYQNAQLDILPVQQVLGDVISGERGILTDDYNQGTTATIQSPIERIEALSWFRLQPVTYSSNFSWRYTPVPGLDPRDRAESDTTVASVATQGAVRGGLSLRLGELFGKIGPYRRLREGQDEAQQAKQQRRQAFQQELQRYRTAQERLAEAEENLREAEAAVEAAAGDSVAAVSAPTEARLEQLRTILSTAQQAADTLARPNPPLPIPNPVDLLRRGFLALTGPRDFTFTYNGSFSGASSGALNPGYSLLDGLTGDGPSLGYRLGFSRRLGSTEADRYFGDEILGTLEVQDILRDNHQFGARTSLEFSQAFRVDLTWDLGLDNQQTFSFTRSTLDDPTVLENGRGNATVLALGGSYDDFFQLHRDRYDRNLAADPDPSDNVIPGDFLSDNAVVEDFRSAFLTGIGSVGRGGFTAFPLPNWTVTYTGVANWPIIRALAQSATLRHGYSATYDVGFRSNPLEGAQNQETLSLPDGSLTFLSDTPFLEANSVRVSERFQPLIGVNLGFKGGIQADINFISSESYALTPTIPSVNQLQTEEVSVRLSFNKTGFRIPLPFLSSRRLNNNLRFSLIVSRANNTARRFTLRDDLEQSISGVIGETFLNPQGEVTTRTSVEPQLSYTLSNQVTATAFVRYQKFDSEGSINPSTTTINGGFTFRVSFSN
ncbi:MAG: cell surface protein SprA [Rhodothermales bacterium]